MEESPVQLNRGALRRDGAEPLYLQLRNLLRRHIAAPEALAAGRLPKEQELARLLGVSRSTVSQALALLAEENLIRRVRRRGTVLTAALDRFDPQSRRSSLGLVWPISQGWRQAIAAMEKQALAAGWHFEVYSYRWDDAADERRSFERAAGNCTGVILYPGAGDDLRFIRELAGGATPCVLFDVYHESVDCDVVSSNHFLGMYRLTEKLLRRGCRRPGLLIHNPHLITVRRRVAGWRAALADFGIAPEPQWIADAESATDAELERWQAANHFDGMASTAGAAARRIAVRPLAQFDRMPGVEAQFTAIQAEDDLGRSAVDMLLAAVANPGRPGRQLFIEPIIHVEKEKIK